MKTGHVLGFICMMIPLALFGEEMLVNGSFSDSLNGWTHYALMGSNTESEAEVVNDTYGPSHGSGPYLWMFGVTTGYIQQCIWQAVTVQAGDTLRPDGAFIDLSGGVLKQYWMELFIGMSEPTDEADYTDNKLLAFDEWANPPCANNMDAMFQTDACVNNTTNGLWVVPESAGTGDVTVYFVIKTGIWEDGTLGELLYDVGVDNLSLYRLNTPSAVHPKPIAMPGEFTLYPNYPNPFNPSTTIRFSQDRTAPVQVTIMNIDGRVVKSLFQDVLGAGTYSLNWNGRDDSGMQLASGIYLYRLNAGSFSQTRQMVFLK